MLRIAQGRVYDPANGIDGEVRDVCLDGGKVVEELPSHAPRIDAGGMVVMPGGVDIHSHIAGPAVNAARKLAPEEHRADVIDRTALTRSGTGGTVPSTFATGYRYALLGYTTVVDAATPPLAARHTLAELRDTPIVDAAFLVLMGNNLPLFKLIREGGPTSTEAVAWWLEATGGYGVKLVNPGGVEMWKHGNRNVTALDDEVEGLGVTPRRVLSRRSPASVDELGLPHPVHVHCNNLGVAGNWRTTLDTLDALQGRRAHLAHLQFHAYGGTPGKRPRSRAPELAEHLDAHPEHSADIGQVMFGPATTMTADAPVSALLRDITGGKWVNADLEAETGLRHRALRVPRAQLRARAAVGHRPGAVPAQPRPLAGRALDRPPQRRLVPELPAAHPPADGSRVPKRADRARQPEGDRAHRAARRPRARVHARGDRDRHPRRSRAGCSGLARQGPSRRRRRCRRDGLQRERGPSRRCSRAPRYVIKGGRVIVEDGELRADAGRGPPARRRRSRREIERTLRAAVRGAVQRAVRELPRARAVAAGARAPGPRPARRERAMRLADAEVVDTFAEAFPMWAARIVITAESSGWAHEAARSLTGFATSVIGCKCEAGIERELDPSETPDGRPGVSALLFAHDRDGLAKRLVERVGQTVLTCPTTACFNGLEGEETVDVGGQLRFFGDGYQASKVLDGRRYWRVPVMEGEFLVRGALRRRRGSGRRQHHHARPRPRQRAARGRGGGGRDALRAAT